MPSISVDLSGDHQRVGREAGTDRLPLIHTTRDWLVDPLEKGMQSGATSLMVIIPATVEGVEVLVLAETSLQCWMMAAAMLRSKFPDEVDQPGWAVLSPAVKDLLRPRYAEAIRRAVPGTTPEQATEAAEMILDASSAGAPNDLFPDQP